jgi:hypothetical protein
MSLYKPSRAKRNASPPPNRSVACFQFAHVVVDAGDCLVPAKLMVLAIVFSCGERPMQAPLPRCCDVGAVVDALSATTLSVRVQERLLDKNMLNGARRLEYFGVDSARTKQSRDEHVDRAGPCLR